MDIFVIMMWRLLGVWASLRRREWDSPKKVWEVGSEVGSEVWG
jgi:hypothetical protein